MAKQQKLTGSEGFDSYYSEVFEDRWITLKDALLKDNVYASWNAGRDKSYFLDAASILAAASLPLEGAKAILDMCAAPGGKSLVIASLMDSDAQLTSNERSFERKQRLDRVLQEHLPDEVFNRTKTSCSDGAILCTKQTECFDRILLDAPCSSERHVLTDIKYLSKWSPSRIKTLSMQQWALLSSGIRLLKAEGYLLYSTCALCSKENDEVIAKALKKFDSIQVCSLLEITKTQQKVGRFTEALLPQYEKTLYGFQILPDKQGGTGPIYFALLKKKSS